MGRPFFCILETPGAGNVIRIVNTSPVEFPMTAGVVPYSINQEMSSGAVLGGDVADNVDFPSADCVGSATTIQGGALRTYPFDPSVDSVQVLLKTDRRPLNARIELLLLASSCH